MIEFTQDQPACRPHPGSGKDSGRILKENLKVVKRKDFFLFGTSRDDRMDPIVLAPSDIFYGTK